MSSLDAVNFHFFLLARQDGRLLGDRCVSRAIMLSFFFVRSAQFQNYSFFPSNGRGHNHKKILVVRLPVCGSFLCFLLICCVILVFHCKKGLIVIPSSFYPKTGVQL